MPTWRFDDLPAIKMVRDWSFMCRSTAWYFCKSALSLTAVPAQKPVVAYPTKSLTTRKYRNVTIQIPEEGANGSRHSASTPNDVLQLPLKPRKQICWWKAHAWTVWTRFLTSSPTAERKPEMCELSENFHYPVTVLNSVNRPARFHVERFAINPLLNVWRNYIALRTTLFCTSVRRKTKSVYYRAMHVVQSAVLLS